MSPIIDKLKKENSFAAILGDFNINLLQINEREKYEDFFDMMCTNNFYPKIMFPTRIAARSHSLLDQIFCKVPCKEKADISASILLSGISDHFPCVVNFKILNKKPMSPKYVYQRTVTESSLDQYRTDLRSLNIHTHLKADLMTDPNESYQIFENLIQTSHQRHFKKKRVKFNKYQHKLSNWITTGILKSIEFRDNLYKRLKLCPVDKPEYEVYKHNLKMYQGYLNQCIRAAKKEYYVNEFTKYKNDIRKTWDTLKGIICKNKMKSEYPRFFTDKGQQITGDKNIADKFNEYFTQIGPSLANSIDIADKVTFDTYLKKPNSSSFQFQYTDAPSVQKIINKLKPKSSAGHDNISSKLLRQIGDIVAYPLSIIVNQSLCTGIFPHRLKLAKVMPLYKKDDNKLFGNYRPISLLSSISKVFEKIVFDQLYDYLITNGLLFESQYSFRKQHSTELAALELTDRIRREMDQDKVPFSVFLDLSKAFDTLNHHILLSKLEYYGIKSIALQWFKSYLTQRQQFVEYQEVCSSTRELETGVPQGSVLGPLLFLIYMNDIHTVSDKLNFILYADDTTLTSPLCSFTHGTHNDVSHISSQINSELLKISDWLTVNKLSLNVEKTKFMVFHNYQRVIANEDIPDLMINDKKIERVSCFNFLGLTINKFMNWSSHSAKIANKISRTLGIMNRLKRYLPFSALKLMYDSLILSHLQFGITCWGFEWNRIFKLQKRALRIMTNSKYNAHTEPLFKELEMLKVSDIFDVQCMKFWYKFVNKSLPEYFGTMFTFNNELYQIETRAQNQLHLFPTRTSSVRNVLRHRIPDLLQEYPRAITQKAKTHSIESFVKLLKAYTIGSYSYECTAINCYSCGRNVRWFWLF